jgi:hypothetical protein
MIRSPKLVARYGGLKAEGCVVVMQVGSFRRVRDEDARAVSAVTGLKLQMAGEVGARRVVSRCPTPPRNERSADVPSAGSRWVRGPGSSVGDADPRRSAEAGRFCPRRADRRHVLRLRSALAATGLPVGWVVETDRCLTRVAERRLAMGWTGLGPYAQSFVSYQTSVEAS